MDGGCRQSECSVGPSASFLRASYQLGLVLGYYRNRQLAPCCVDLVDFSTEPVDVGLGSVDRVPQHDLLSLALLKLVPDLAESEDEPNRGKRESRGDCRNSLPTHFFIRRNASAKTATITEPASIRIVKVQPIASAFSSRVIGIISTNSSSFAL